MRKALIVVLFAMFAAVGATAASAAPQGVEFLDNGVAVINGDVLAPASTPAGALAYGAHLTRDRKSVV